MRNKILKQTQHTNRDLTHVHHVHDSGEKTRNEVSRQSQPTNRALTHVGHVRDSGHVRHGGDRTERLGVLTQRGHRGSRLLGKFTGCGSDEAI